MKIIWGFRPKYRERFDGVAVSTTGVARRDPVGLIESPKVQNHIKLIREFRESR